MLSPARTGMTPPFGPRNPPGATFFAELLVNPDARLQRATVTRASEASYRSRSDGDWTTIAANQSRHEFSSGDPLGMLVEVASTNKCTSENANPTSGLTGITAGGDAALVVSRVQDVAALAAADLDGHCTDGNVVELDNSGGATGAWVTFDGEVGNTNDHTGSAWVRGDGDGYIDIQGGAAGSGTLTAGYSRVTVTETPDATTRKLQFHVAAGVTGYIILWQLEQHIFATSPIVNSTGVATSRPRDEIVWAETDRNGTAVVNQSEGMIAIECRYDQISADVHPASGLGLTFSEFDAEPFFFVSIHPVNDPVITLRGNVSGGSNLDATTSFTGLGDSVHVVFVGLWEQSTGLLRTGFKSSGSWTWGTAQSTFNAFNDAVGSTLQMINTWQPVNLCNYTLWHVNRGTGWLEQYFSGIAE